EDTRCRIFVVNLALRKGARRFPAGQSAAGAVIYRVTAFHRPRQRPQNVTEILVAAGNEHRMASLFPNRAAQKRITGRESSCRAFSMHPDIIEFGMPLPLHKVVTDLINQLELRIEG